MLINILVIINLHFSLANDDGKFKFTPPANCTNIRLDKPPGALADIPTYDMGRRVFCGAPVSATLANAEIAKNVKPPKFVSPINIAVQYAHKKNKPDLLLEYALDIVLETPKIPMCSYNLIGDTINSKKSSEFIQLLYNSYSDKDPKSLLQCLNQAGLGNQISDLNKIRQYLNAPTEVEFYAKLFQDICKNDSVDLSKLPPLKVTESTEIAYINRQNAARNKFTEIIDENLKKNTPVGVNYCETVMKNPSVNGVNNQGIWSDECYVNLPNGQKVSAGHSSTVVGRRLVSYMDKGVQKHACQYLVRNVRGASCNGFPPDESTTPSERCENGQVWLDEDALLFNTREVFHY